MNLKVTSAIGNLSKSHKGLLEKSSTWYLEYIQTNQKSYVAYYVYLSYFSLVFLDVYILDCYWCFAF